MAWTYITYSCGHDNREQCRGPRYQRERYIADALHRLCPDCYRDERDEASAAALANAAEAGLPALEGTERQVGWAAQIREKALQGAKNYVEKVRALLDRIPADARGPQTDAEISRILRTLVGWEALAANTSAKWWIDNRDANFLSLIQKP